MAGGSGRYVGDVKSSTWEKRGGRIRGGRWRELGPSGTIDARWPSSLCPLRSEVLGRRSARQLCHLAAARPAVSASAARGGGRGRSRGWARRLPTAANLDKRQQVFRVLGRRNSCHVDLEMDKPESHRVPVSSHHVAVTVARRPS